MIRWTLALLSSSSRWSNSVSTITVGSKFRLSKSFTTKNRRMLRRRNPLLLWWEVQPTSLMTCDLNMMLKFSYQTTCLRPHSLICPKLMDRVALNWHLQKVFIPWNIWRTCKIVKLGRKNHQQRPRKTMRFLTTKVHQRQRISIMMRLSILPRENSNLS